MLAENPLALRFFLNDDVYLLPVDRLGLHDRGAEQAANNISEATAEIGVVAQPAEIAVATTAGPEVAEAAIEMPRQSTPLAEELKIPKFTAPEAKVPVAASVAQPEVDAPTAFVALGGNQKNVLVLVNYPQAAFMADAHLQALENAFARLDYARADFAIFNIARYPNATFDKLSTHFKPQVLLILGADSYPQGLPQQPFNQLREGKGGRKLLFTYSFNEMMGDKEKTRAYWEQMKSL